MASYTNPFSLPGQPFASLADPTLLEHEDRYYLFSSGRQAWSSSDLMSWQYHPVALPKSVVAPALVEYEGTFYLSGNGLGMFEAPHPLGPWRYAGDVETTNGKRIDWADPMFFVDDDRRVYSYHNLVGGVGTEGVYVTELDPAASLRRARSETRHCFGYVREHRWERWGDCNEFPDVAWIEAPWMTKHRGRYYLQYSGAGTEWKSYAIGLYTSDSPLGPFVYDSRSPLLCQRGGMLAGTGHHALLRGPKGTLHNFYHVLFRNGNKFDRRLALDPASFDESGRLTLHGPSETPRSPPGEREIADCDLGWLPLTTNKPVRASTAAPGRDAPYAVDHYVRTWWQAVDASWPQWLEVDLCGDFVVRAFRLIFAPTHARGQPVRGSYAYRIESSMDGSSFGPLFDAKDDDRDIQYHEVSPTRARKVRIVMQNGYDDTVAGLIDFSVFGGDGA